MDDTFDGDVELTLQTLNFATRVIASGLDQGRLFERSLDTLCDFAVSSHAALLLASEEDERLDVTCVLEAGRLVDVPTSIEPSDHLRYVMQRKRPKRMALAEADGVPLPGAQPPGEEEPACLCLPLVDSQLHPIGVVTLRQDEHDPLPPHRVHALTALSTIVALMIENTRLFEEATVDGLTGLHVRRYFEIRLLEEVSRIRRHGGSVALILTDIDHFKSVNDTYGHTVGDRVLRRVADILMGSIRQDLDIASRYGGEEFVTILPETDLEGAVRLAERFRGRCEDAEPTGSDPQVTVSCGVAAVDADSLCTSEELVERADSVLYQAKESGRNQVCAWTSA